MRRTFPERRGSALMLAVILSAIVAVISASYLKMATHESKFSYTSFLRNGALNLAEAGAEEAIWALNNDDISSWATSASGDFIYKKAVGFDYDQAKSTSIQMIIEDPTGDPTITARGVLTLPDGRIMDKILRIELVPRQVAPNGLTAKDTITFSGGNVGFDAYDSQSTDIIGSVEDEGTVATTSIVNDAANISNSDVMGGVATGGGTVNMGPNARVFDAGDVNDYGSPALIPSGYVNPELVTNDFRADFPAIDAPSGGTFIPVISSNTTLSSGTYIVDSITLTGSKRLNIDGDVTLVVKGDVKVSGSSAAININQSTGKLKMYIDGNMAVAGNGIVNVAGTYNPTPNGTFGVTPSTTGAYPKPESLIIYGTGDSSQSFSYSGNAALAGVIYAPNAAVSLNGGGSGGELLGAIVANTIKVTGNYGFHYDIQLKNLFFEEDSYRMESWNELTTEADKTKYRNEFAAL
ncbi:DUF7305 domain-containing protein [Cerasicoccus arenae]|uniref:DUF7305 domain-containing protein n=1 Tax=Cerasicoccus arenae TaxID=424488 RepID=A0A8J3DD45_9BACT|nr:hypothetical protein [Cerasicoccus arenae]MBK1858569.1 hypothetical protein [Cerasicoccus arenae]GHC06354.1 hypothetical protein GCM10007047_24350 [Cerasicoccus arenae]